MSSRFKLIFWGALFVAASATFGVYRILAANSAGARVVTTPVVVATRDLPEGVEIDRAAVSIEQWPLATVPAGAFAELDSVAGRVTSVPVFQGEPMVPGRLAPHGTGPGLELKIPPGQRAMAVRINDVAGISGLIQPNSRVDVLVTIRASDSESQVAKVFMENMRVLGVGTTIQRDASGKAIHATTVTLSVTPEESERLAVAMNEGTIQLVLRGYGEDTGVVTRGATSRDVLRDLGRPQPARTAPAPQRSRPAAARPTPPPPAPEPVYVAPPVRRPDSAVVNIYRGTTPTTLKFDTAGTSR